MMSIKQNKHTSVHNIYACSIAFLMQALMSSSFATDDLTSLPDPTRPYQKTVTAKPATTAVVKQKTWVLSSTVVANDRKIAVINNKLVQLGEVINGAKVVTINPYSVVLQEGHNRYTLRVLKNGIVQKSSVEALP